MFGPERRQVLKSSCWNPTDNYAHLVGSLEAWNIDNRKPKPVAPTGWSAQRLIAALQ